MGSAICGASKRRVNLPDVPAESKELRRLPLGLPPKRDLLFMCQQQRDIFRPSLVDKTYPGDYTSGATGPATAPAR